MLSLGDVFNLEFVGYHTLSRAPLSPLYEIDSWFMRLVNFDLWRFSQELSLWFWFMLAYSCWMRFIFEIDWVNTPIIEWKEEEWTFVRRIGYLMCCTWRFLFLLIHVLIIFMNLGIFDACCILNLKAMQWSEPETNFIGILVFLVESFS